MTSNTDYLESAITAIDELRNERELDEPRFDHLLSLMKALDETAWIALDALRKEPPSTLA